MAIGELRHFIYIVRPMLESDGHGGQRMTGFTKKAAWAHIKSASGTEALADGAVTNTQTRTLIIRRTDINAADYVLIDGEKWLISDVEALEDKPFYMSVLIRRNSITGG